MLSPLALAPAVAACHAHATRLDVLLYRAIALTHFSPVAAAQPLYAMPGPQSRYVGPGGPAALYAAEDPETAYREGNQEFYRLASTAAGRSLVRAGGLRPTPVVLIGVYVTATRVLDLTGPAVRGVLQIAADAELLTPWKLVAAPTPTQVLGDQVFAYGFFEGIVYPSAQNPGRRCVVLYPSRLAAGSSIDFRSLTPGLGNARRP